MMKKNILLIVAMFAIGAQPGYSQDKSDDASSKKEEVTLATHDFFNKNEQKGTKIRNVLGRPNFEPIDREINKLDFAYKGEYIAGVAISHISASSENSELMLVLDGITAKGSYTSLKPFVGYFYRDNRCFGVRFGYSNIDGSINSANLDLGESNDMSFAIPKITNNSHNVSYSIFHRAYAGVDNNGRFGLFSEVELEGSNGKNSMSIDNDGEITSTNNKTGKIALNFNPGIAVYMFPNFCITASFGLGGIHYSHISQLDELGNKIGSRETSKLAIKVNLMAINLGMTLHFWSNNDKTNR